MSVTSRYDDCWRHANTWESYERKLAKELGREPTDEEVREAYKDALRKLDLNSPLSTRTLKGGDESELNKYIGDDLSESDLDDLWSMIADGDSDSLMASWWADKPHQIMYRLLLRLTRAELEEV
jgi:hypothetical protein